MLLTVRDIVEAVRLTAPEELQEEWDNSGIQISTGKDSPVRCVMACLEISDAVIREAEERGADMIVTHHPLLFRKIDRIDGDTIVGRQLLTLVRNGISVYSAHTSFDSAAKGTNQYLAEKLELEEIRPMIPSAGREDCGMGRIGVCRESHSFSSFYRLVDRICGRSALRVAGIIPEQVHTVALCTGAGAEFMDLAADLGADVYVTGDVKYHEARHAADRNFCVLDAGHFGTEVIFADNMAGQLQEILGQDVEILVSDTSVNPFLAV